MLLSIILIICVFLLILCFYQLFFGIDAGCMNPVHIFVSKISDKDFNQLLNDIFDNDCRYDHYEVYGRGYAIWIANGYYGLSIMGPNFVYESEDLSYFQKRRLFKRVKLLKATQPEMKNILSRTD